MDRWGQRGRFACSLGAVMVVAVAATATAQPSRIDRGLPSVLRGGRPGLDSPGHASVVIELAAGATPADVELPGVTLVMLEDGPLAWRSFVPASIDDAGLAALVATPAVARVRLASPRGDLALDVTTEMVGVPRARAVLPERATGAGVLIADLDTHVDLFHPSLFRADAGYFDWVDRNSDGVFSAGDGIDIDRDGLSLGTERATVLLAATFEGDGTPAAIPRRAIFDPSIDWLFLDINGNGVRDVGGAAGWGDDAPGFGEPIFVPDDVDRDGLLEPAERVIQLGTSKVRGLFLALPSGATGVTMRGAGLADVARDYTRGSDGYADTLHATGVAGILVGDVPLIGRRFVGVAPDADLVVAARYGGPADADLVWALTQAPDVVVVEYGGFVDVLLDGGGVRSAMIDASADTVAHVCAAGNIGGRGKHASAVLAPGETRDIPFRQVMRALIVSLHVPVGADVRVTLVEPSGVEHDHAAGDGVLSTGERLQTWDLASDRAFDVRSFAFQLATTTPLPSTPWLVRVRGDPSSPVTVHGFIRDERGQSRSSAWTTPDERSTLTYPATSDGCLAVGAVTGHAATDGPWFEPLGREPSGSIRLYSSRGPRINGGHSIGVVGPDNPWCPLGAGEVYPDMPGSFVAPEGAFQILGGTSSSTPHVAGALALLAQAGVHGRDAIAAITGSAIADVVTGAVPNDDYGHGRLDIAGALGSTASAHDPHLLLSALSVGAQILVRPVVTDEDGESVEVRWDLGYDGTWDGEYVAPDGRLFDLPAGGLRLKVRARDAGGRINEAVLLIRRIEDVPASDAGAPDAGPGAASTGGCGCRAASTSKAPGALAAALALVIGRRRRRAARAARRHASRLSPSTAR